MKNTTLKPYPHYICKNCLVENTILTSEQMSKTFVSSLKDCECCGEEEFYVKPEIFGNPKIQGFENE
jgi:DNA polymerase III alpha subunit (gram-positive type)